MTKKKIATTKKELKTSKKKQLKKTDKNLIPNIPLKSSFPIVGIGASAGGLAAFEAFFAALPTNTKSNVAFVLVQHLSPDHKSILSELIARDTQMPVFEVEEGMTVKPNCIYIIPPNRDMALMNGILQLMEPSAPHGYRLPIDFFFRSLAQDQHERAICIVLSGTGSDGTLGLRAIKDEGGMVMAQNPASTEYDGMPRSAIATGLVDYQLPPAEMPAQLFAYINHAFGKLPRAAITTSLSNGENALNKIFILLRSKTSHDFSQYKSSTIYRRIERRMAVHQIETMDKYVSYLQQTPDEVEALFCDLLISVTSFFRDPEAFKVLEEKVIPKLFNGKPAGAVIRIWVAGCSTGEEVYSLAILLKERLELLKQEYKLQIFSTDIDSKAIAIARAGIYPASITKDILPERLSSFFTAEPDGSQYRIHKNIRDMIIFSEQDVIKDPPFSRLDLISCRNLLIYMNRDLQKKIIPLFCYALNPGGFLFLGTSENLGEHNDLFTILDRKWKIYQRRDDIQSAYRPKLVHFLPSIREVDDKKEADIRKLPLREITEKALLKQLSPAGALVNNHGDVLYIYGRTGLYLEPTQGETGVNNILKMAREGLQHELTKALQKTIKNKEVVSCPNLRIKTNGESESITVNLTVRPVAAHPVSVDGKSPIASTEEESLYLVILEQVPPLGTEQPQIATALQTGKGAKGLDTEVEFTRIRKELSEKEEYLHASNEELETSNEELRSSNEEMQSMNEELQSTNEEMETSKEELQSVNEELATVNAEMQTKVEDLSRVNNDMNNLLAGTGIATVFLDRRMNILRFTPATTTIINLIMSDVGRPVGHIVSNLVDYNRITEDTQEVLDSLIPKELEVHNNKGTWYNMKILPYRTLENVIDGAVITFMDISRMKKAESSQRLAVIVSDSYDAIILQDLKGSILGWNPAAVKMYGWSEEEALAMNIRDLIPESLHEKELVKVKKLSQSKVLKPYSTKRVTKDKRIMEVWMTATVVKDKAGEVYAITTTEREKLEKKYKHNRNPKGTKS